MTMPFNRYEDLEPLEWHEDEQRWGWPPTRNDGRVFGTTVRRWENIVKALAGNEGGAIDDESGFATKKLQALVGERLSNSAFNALLLGLIELGLVTKEVRGKRTFRIALAVPVEQLPEALQAKQTLPEATVDVQAPVLQAPVVDAVDYHTLAMELLDEVVKRANEPEGDGELAEQLELHKRRADNLVEIRRKLQDELSQTTDRAKSLRKALDDSEAQRKTLERNLTAALAACRDLADKAGTRAREETVQGLERLMRRSREQ